MTPEEKKQRQNQYKAKYDALHMKSFSVKMKKKDYAGLEKHISDIDTNRNRFVNEAIMEKLKRDSLSQV